MCVSVTGGGWGGVGRELDEKLRREGIIELHVVNCSLAGYLVSEVVLPKQRIPTK